MKYPTFDITDEGRDFMENNEKLDWTYQRGYSEQLGALDYLSEHGPTKCNILRKKISPGMPKEEWIDNMNKLQDLRYMERVLE